MLSISTLVCQLQSRAGWPVYISDKSFRKPDFAFGTRGFLLPTLVGEVSYSRRFTRSQLKAKYQAYLTKSNDEILTVVCVDLYYAGTGDKILQRQGILIAPRSASGFCETVLSRPRWTGSLCPRRAPGSIFTYPTSLTPVMSCPLNLSVRVMGLSFSFSASVFPYMSDA